MKNKKSVFFSIQPVALFWCFLPIILLASEKKVIISDNFERNYNDSEESLESYGYLGATKEGYKWRRRDIHKNGPDLHGPGILEYKANNKGMIWKNPNRTTDIVFLSDLATKVRNFKMEFDYWRKGNISPHGVSVNFRMPRAGGAVSDGGTNSGYGLLFDPASTNSAKVKLFSDYGFSKDSAEIWWDGSMAHIILIAEDNHFKVYVGETLALDVTDDTANPARNKSGFFTLQLNNWRPDEHGLDNWIVSSFGDGKE